ncbi:Nucleolar protein 12 [Aspergillus nanangensis]|uniref:Nucleolar protein 12 n=1 Tax=Aspergillus nanangensis TaxID=2582783 RepID=A0AAD4H016_ASPNN|nr:Nucleolar protein 12 [Aspergillus nanangensis]
MGKKSKSKSEKTPQTEQTDAGAALPFLGGNSSVDPSLASLFENSLGPVKAPAPRKAEEPRTQQDKGQEDEVLSEIDEELDDEDDEAMEDAADNSGDEPSPESAAQSAEHPGRKRKRANWDDLEESYMRRLAKEEQKEDEKRRAEKAKRQKVVDGEKDSEEDSDAAEESDNESSEEEEEDKAKPIPKHETQGESSDLDRSNRTVFLGNVSNDAIKSKSAKKTLLKHLASVLSSLPESTGPHKVETIRFRSTAFSSGGELPKRASFAKKEILDETTLSTNAYAVYSTVQGARKALSLNGTVVLDRHLRVDSVAHPAKTDNKRCVFVGNLDFVDQESNAEGEEKKKKRAPADVEEGLWRIFNARTGAGASKGDDKGKGSVESVRVIRDRATRVGKGFAYVQFYDANCVEEALVLNEKNFPPMLPRKLRVTRARKMMKKRDEGNAPNKSLRDADKTLHGRAGKLFGRAGAAKMRDDSNKTISSNSTVFEGHRATEGGSSAFKVKTKSRGSKGKPKNRSSKRAAAFREAGGRKGN